MANMVDVSSNNHSGGKPIAWSKLAELYGIEAVMIKATEGTGYLNPWLAKDAHGARAAGLSVGYYHFAHPGQAEPKAEVEYFARAVESLPHELGLCLDLEVSEGLNWAQLAEWGETYLEQLREHADWTIHYTNRSWLDALKGAPWGHRLWLASPGVRPRQTVWAWQYAVSSDGDLAGFDVDELYEIPSGA